jgi:hypothetical protein
MKSATTTQTCIGYPLIKNHCLATPKASATPDNSGWSTGTHSLYPLGHSYAAHGSPSIAHRRRAHSRVSCRTNALDIGAVAVVATQRNVFYVGTSSRRWTHMRRISAWEFYLID